MSGCEVVKILKEKLSCFMLVERAAEIFIKAENIVVFVKVKPSDLDTLVIIRFINIILKFFNNLLL